MSAQQHINDPFLGLLDELSNELCDLKLEAEMLKIQAENVVLKCKKVISTVEKAQGHQEEHKKAPIWYELFCEHCFDLRNSRLEFLIEQKQWQVMGYISALLATKTIHHHEYMFLHSVSRNVYQHAKKDAENEVRQEILTKSREDQRVFIDEGFTACLNRKTSKDNPYPEDTEKHNDWKAGWTHCCHALPL